MKLTTSHKQHIEETPPEHYYKCHRVTGEETFDLSLNWHCDIPGEHELATKLLGAVRALVKEAREKGLFSTSATAPMLEDKPAAALLEGDIKVGDRLVFQPLHPHGEESVIVTKIDNGDAVVIVLLENGGERLLRQSDVRKLFVRAAPVEETPPFHPRLVGDLKAGDKLLWLPFRPMGGEGITVIAVDSEDGEVTLGSETGRLMTVSGDRVRTHCIRVPE